MGTTRLDFLRDWGWIMDYRSWRIEDLADLDNEELMLTAEQIREGLDMRRNTFAAGIGLAFGGGKK
jgi:hypothetical protein